MDSSKKPPRSSTVRSNSPSPNEIQLSAPWGKATQQIRSASVAANVQRGFGDKVATTFVEERSKVHDTYIREYNKTKRLGLAFSIIALLLACIVVIFAPDGRETVSYFIGAFLILTAAGAAGLTFLKLKMPGFSLDARKVR